MSKYENHTLDVRHIAAAINTAASKDIRFYLNGVFVQNNIVVATDGHCLSAFKTVESASYLPEFIIPLDAAKIIAKLKAQLVTVKLLDDNRIDIGGVVFAPIEGRFPDWRRVMGTANAEGDRVHDMHAHPEIFLKFVKIAKLFKVDAYNVALVPNNKHSFSVGIAGLESEFMGVLMPYKARGIEYGNWA